MNNNLQFVDFTLWDGFPRAERAAWMIVDGVKYVNTGYEYPPDDEVIVVNFTLENAREQG